MPKIRTRNLFISHSWKYASCYYRLKNLLNNKPYFRYKDYSIPLDDPINNAKNRNELYQAIKYKIKPSQVILIMAGVYSTYSNWIQKELKIAKNDFNKPVIAICPWGAEKISIPVQESSDAIVNWNTKSIVDQIREFC